MDDSKPIMNLAGDAPKADGRRPVTWRPPSAAEAERFGPTARVLDIVPGEQVFRNNPMKDLKRTMKVSSRQWKKRSKAIKRAIKARSAQEVPDGSA